MTDRAAGAPRVDAMLDRLGDKLSSDGQPKKPAVPRPLLGRIPAPAPPPRKAELPSSGPTEPDAKAGAAAAAAEVKSALDGPPYPEPTTPDDPLDGPPFAGAAPRTTDPLDGAPFPAGPPPAPTHGPLDGAVYPPEPGVLERFPAADAAMSARSALEDAPTAEDTGSSDSLPPPSAAPIEHSGLAEPSLPAAEAAADAFAEFEKGELPADSTRVEDRELLADESTNMLREETQHPILAVESGRDTGREFTLQEGETSVGRGIDNDIILTDVSVSRKHMRVLVDHEGITLIDLGSGNGTTLNGRRVHRALLGDGDRIEIGETVFVARVPGAKPDLYQQPTVAAPVESTSDERLPSADVHAPPAPWTPPYPAYPSAVPPPEPTPGRGTNILLGRGTLLLGAAMLVIIASMIGAIAMAFLLHEEPPTGVVGGPAVVSLPAAPAPVLPGASATPAPPATSVTSLPPLPPAPLPPPVLPPPAPVAPAIGTAAPPVSPLAASGGPTTTPVAPAATTDPVVPAPPPTSTADEPDEEPEERPEPRTGSGPRERGGGSTSRTTPSARAVARPSGDQPDPRIVAAYRRQDFTGAAQLARAQADGVTGRQRTQLEQLARNIETFARRWPEARRGNFAAIEEAYRVDRRIVGGEGAFGSELAPRLVAGYVQRARGAMASQPADACGDVRAAMALSSGNAEARTLFRDCETRARRMLGEAQRLERNEPARARMIYGDIVSMLGTTHEVSRDATARLVAMGRTTSTGPRARPVDEDE